MHAIPLIAEPVPTPEGPEARLARAAALLQALGACAGEVLAALQVGDLERMEAALAARDDLIRHAASTLDEIHGAGSPDADAGEAGLAALLPFALEVQEIDARCALALAAEHRRAGRELDSLDGEEAVRTAYGRGPAPEGRRINLVR